MIKKFFLFSLLATISVFKLLAQDGALIVDGLPLKYLARKPMEKSAHPSIIILLHGRGGNENSLFRYSPQLPKDAVIIAPRGPFELGNGAYAWYHVTEGGEAPEPDAKEAEKSRMILSDFIDQVAKKFKIPASRVYVMGFSQGGAMALSVGLTHPEFVKGVVSMSGRVLDDVKKNLGNKEQLKHTSIFMGHGSHDKLLPVKFARENHEFLKTNKILVAYHEYEIGHEIGPDEMKDVKEWFKKN